MRSNLVSNPQNWGRNAKGTVADSTDRIWGMCRGPDGLGAPNKQTEGKCG